MQSHGQGCMWSSAVMACQARSILGLERNLRESSGAGRHVMCTIKPCRRSIANDPDNSGEPQITPSPIFPHLSSIPYFASIETSTAPT